MEEGQGEDVRIGWEEEHCERNIVRARRNLFISLNLTFF